MISPNSHPCKGTARIRYTTRTTYSGAAKWPATLIRDATQVRKKNRKTENIYFCHQWPLPSPQTLSNCHKFYWQKSPWQECVSVNRSSIGHLTFTVRPSLAQTWHLWIDCSADGNIRLTRCNVNKMQPALASSDATRYTKLPSSDRMVNQPTPQTRSSCSQGSRFLWLKIHSTLSGVFQMKF